MNNKIATIICNRITKDSKEYTEGFKKKCEECNHIIWVSNSSVLAVKEESPDITPDQIGFKCQECGFLDFVKNPNIELINPTKDQINEIYSLMKERISNGKK